jgi:hypothetical protein
VLTQHPKGSAERLLAIETGGAGAAGQARIYHDPVARRHRADRRADCIHDACGVATDDMGKPIVYAGKSLGDQEVEMIEGRPFVPGF